MTSKEPAKKRGKRTEWVGKQWEFVQEFYPTYSKASKHGKTRDIWTKAFVRYWAAFPWRLPLKQDPDPEDPTYALTLQTPEEEAERKKIITVTEAVSRVVLRCKHANLFPENQGVVCTPKELGEREEQPLGGMAYAFSHPSRAHPKEMF
jgi:hypothetical protein